MYGEIWHWAGKHLLLEKYENSENLENANDVHVPVTKNTGTGKVLKISKKKEVVENSSLFKPKQYHNTKTKE